MAWPFVLIAGVLLGTVLAQWVLGLPGYALLTFRELSIQLSMPAFIGMLALGFSGALILAQLGIWLWQLPARLHKQRRRREEAATVEQVIEGFWALAEGRFADAEARLTRNPRQVGPGTAEPGRPAAAVLRYLGAARAAQSQGYPQRRDEYLRCAIQVYPEAQLAVGLVQAELQLEQGQQEQALATLEHLHRRAPQHSLVLQRLAELYQHLGDSHRLLALLPMLRTYSSLSGQALANMEAQAARAKLRSAVSQRDVNALVRAWDALPPTVQAQPEMAATYAANLQALGAADQALAFIRQRLAQADEPSLAALLGELEVAEPRALLEEIDGWLGQHGEDPKLLASAGRLAMRAAVWERARDYLERSLAQERAPQTYWYLGQVLLAIGDAGAQQMFRAGLGYALGQSLTPQPVPVSPGQQPVPVSALSSVAQRPGQQP